MTNRWRRTIVLMRTKLRCDRSDASKISYKPYVAVTEVAQMFDLFSMIRHYRDLPLLSEVSISKSKKTGCMDNFAIFVREIITNLFNALNQI